MFDMVLNATKFSILDAFDGPDYDSTIEKNFTTVAKRRCSDRFVNVSRKNLRWILK